MNNITNVSSTYDRTAFVGDTGDKKLEGPKNNLPEKKNEVQNDQVSLSSGSKDLMTAKEAALAAPDQKQEAPAAGRSEKVEQLKQDVQTGNYQINAENVAEKLIGTVVSKFV